MKLRLVEITDNAIFNYGFWYNIGDRYIVADHEMINYQVYVASCNYYALYPERGGVHKKHVKELKGFWVSSILFAYKIKMFLTGEKV